MGKPFVLRAPEARGAQNGKLGEPRLERGLVAAVGAERLRKKPEFGRVHPGGERAADRQRLTTRARAQRGEEGALRLAQLVFFKDGEARRGALFRHGLGPG